MAALSKNEETKFSSTAAVRYRSSSSTCSDDNGSSDPTTGSVVANALVADFFWSYSDKLVDGIKKRKGKEGVNKIFLQHTHTKVWDQSSYWYNSYGYGTYRLVSLLWWWMAPPDGRKNKQGGTEKMKGTSTSTIQRNKDRTEWMECICRIGESCLLLINFTAACRLWCVSLLIFFLLSSVRRPLSTPFFYLTIF